MKSKSASVGWGACFGVLGLLTLAGAVVTLADRPAAQAQTPPRTPVQIFNRACGRCHPDGGEDTGPDLHNKNQTIPEITHTIRVGTKRMRAIPTTRLSDADLAAMIPFLQSIHAVR